MIQIKYKRNYHSKKYKKWRKDVYKRDGYQCQWPNCPNNSKNKRLNAHHIKPWMNNPTLRYIISNGITLCSMHHALIHSNSAKSYEDLCFRLINKCLRDTINGFADDD